MTLLFTLRNECLAHTLRRCLTTGEVLESIESLPHCHARAIDDGTANFFSFAQQLGLQRQINDIADPLGRLQDRGVKGRTCQLSHTNGSCINDAVSLLNVFFYISHVNTRDG